MNEAKQMVKDLVSQVADVGAVSQNINSNQMPDEMRALLGELPNWIEQRKGALQRIQQAYDQDPRMRETPLQAQARGMFANGRPGDAGYATAMGEYERQKLQDYQLQQKLAREKSTLEALDLGTFDKLYSSVQKNLASSKDKQQMVGSADQGWWAYNFDTGEKKLLIPGTLQEKQKARLRESIYDRLKTEGGDQSEWAKKADELSHAIIYKYSPEQVESYLNSGVPAVAGEKVASNSPYPEVKTPSIVQQKFGDKVETALVSGQGEDAQFNKDVETALASYSDLKISDDEKIKRAYEYASKLNPGVISSAKPVTKTIPSVPGVITKTPEQKKLLETQFENYSKEYDSDRAAISALRNQAPSINVMKTVLSNPDVKYVSGPLHEELVAVAGFMNYIDPTSSIVNVGDTIPAYFSNMMNLVRDKIKALGSGTAVSNLDLIITQKSVGDLRNTPEGNKKLLAIMELQNATLNDRLQKRVAYFEGNKDGYKGYEEYANGFGSAPTHMILRNQNTGDYKIVGKDEWLKQGEVVLRNAGKPVTEDNLNKLWQREADYSVAAMLKGTGVQYKGVKQ